MKKKLVLKFDGMHTEKKRVHKFYVRKVLEENLVTHERFDFIK